MIPYSVLDLSPITRGATVRDALLRSLELARAAESDGYLRYWVAEHHNLPGIASAATPVVIGHLAAGTSRIRVGSGGVMLPNHSPLVVAEQFGTLESLFPGRIDLGLGRAPGTDPVTARALRRGQADTSDAFPEDVRELESYFSGTGPVRGVQAVPATGLSVPFWLLGSSTYSAGLAAELGLRFGFAAHFAPDLLGEALAIYRRRFRPSAQLARSYALAAIPVYAAATDEQARDLFTSIQQSFVALRRGGPIPLPPPAPGDLGFSPLELRQVGHFLREAIVGGPATVEDGLRRFLARTQVDEVMVTAAIYDPAAHRRSFALVAEAMQRIQPAPVTAGGTSDRAA